MTPLTRRTAVVALTAGLLAAAVAVPAEARTQGGTLILVGGALADTNHQIYGEMVDRAGGANARFGVFTAASVPLSQDPDAGTPDASNSEANGKFYADLLKKHGAGSAEWVPIDLDHMTAADDPALAARVRSMTGFFFGGGDQYRYVLTMIRDGKDSLVLRAIRDRLNEGAVVAGTSAGAQIHAGRDMVTGGVSYLGLRDGAQPGYFEDDRLGYHPAGGFGFFTHGLLDSHFSQRGRQGRSIKLAADTGHDRVFGLDPNTALEVTGVGTGRERLTVLGQRGISVLDMRQADGTTGVRWSYLTSGDTYDPYTWSPRVSSPLHEAKGRTAKTPSQDIFGSYEMTDVALDLATAGRSRSTYGLTLESNPRFRVTLTKEDGFRAWASGSFADLWVSITKE
ncbi:cyanophycinase [Streptosporangium sp. NPDC087985]|uniref:cyanophycinase n=1 Tax=Streptosporangium sp. NPDC087985 TaxID=3366196 RepID=UPI00380F25F1